MLRIFLGAMLIIASISLANGQTTATATRKAIEANTQSFVTAFNKGDAAAVAAMYATDAKALPPNNAIVQGRANIQAFHAGAIQAGVKLVSLTPVDVTTGGNLAIETGKYVITAPAAGGGTTTDEGKYVVVWQRQGSRWVILRDIWNSDKAQ